MTAPRPSIKVTPWASFAVYVINCSLRIIYEHMRTAPNVATVISTTCVLLELETIVHK